MFRTGGDWLGDALEWLNDHRGTVEVPADAPDGWPRLFSPKHPDAVGSLAGEWCEWLESESGGGVKLRPWQRLVLERALEVDADGQLCWRNVVVSTGRQSGKSVLARSVMVARCEFAERFGEPQECLHVANALVAARRIHAQAWKWAADRGLDIRRAMGNERVIWPDGSHWSVVATKSVYGASGGAVCADEAWDLEREVVENALVPTMLERVQPQLWLLSTANDAATDLVPHYRREALAGSSRVMVAEWSVPPSEDGTDADVWRRFSPFWSRQREEFMAMSVRSPSFGPQYLNRWPESQLGVPEWPEGWSRAGAAVEPTPGGVAAMESTLRRDWFGCAYAWRVGNGVGVVTARFRDRVDAEGWLSKFGAARFLVGLSLRDWVALPGEVEGVGSRQLYGATQVLDDVVRRGLLTHDGGEAVGEQTRWARLVRNETGQLLSGKASRGPIDVLKAVAWAVDETLKPSQAPSPAIY